MSLFGGDRDISLFRHLNRELINNIVDTKVDIIKHAIRDIKENFSCPIAVYQVSGEYSMLKAAAEKGWLDEKKVIIEQLTAFKRSGASMIVSYHSIDIAKSL